MNKGLLKIFLQILLHYLPVLGQNNILNILFRISLFELGQSENTLIEGDKELLESLTNGSYFLWILR